MKFRILILPFVVLVVVGCIRGQKENTIIDTIDAYANNLNVEVSIDDFILLESSKAGYFSNIDKLRYENGNLYIYDFASSKILKYGSDGKFITQIGRVGRARDEYIKADEFNLHNDTLVVIDNRQDKMLSYNIDGRFIKSVKLPYYVNAMEILSNNDILFILHNNKLLSVDNKQIIVANSNLSNNRTVRSYKGDEQSEYRPKSYIEEFNGSYIVNMPISDELYIIDSIGHHSKTIKFDFGEKRVPDNLRSSFIDLLDKINSGSIYTYITSTPMSLGNYIIGNIAEGNKKNTVVTDINSCKSIILPFDKPDKYKIANINTPLCVYDDKIVTMLTSSIIDKSNVEYKELPSNVQAHLERGDFVLCLLKIK